MKRLTMGLSIIITMTLFALTASAEVKQADIKVNLKVPQIIKLYVAEGYEDVSFVPGPEDYARNFLDRADAVKLWIFTNARTGGKLYVHGNQPSGPQGILRLEDTYLTVMTEKTYILVNNLETNQDCNPYRTDAKTGDVKEWLKLHNEAQQIFTITQSTKADRLIVFKLGVGNLARYTEGNYSNSLTFTFMPTVL